MSAAPEKDIGDILKKSWEVFMKDPATHIIANLLFLLGSVFSLGILAAPLMVGYIRLIRDLMAGRQVSATDIFSGLSTTITSLITMIIIGIAITIGLFLLVLPGIAVGFLVAFAFHFIAYKDSGIMDSMSESFNLVKDNFVLVLIVIIIVAVINMIGSSVFIGSLLTVPFGMIMMNITYERLTGQGGRS